MTFSLYSSIEIILQGFSSFVLLHYGNDIKFDKIAVQENLHFFKVFLEILKGQIYIKVDTEIILIYVKIKNSFSGELSNFIVLLLHY